jgi:hypothetical protein
MLAGPFLVGNHVEKSLDLLIPFYGCYPTIERRDRNLETHNYGGFTKSENTLIIAILTIHQIINTNTPNSLIMNRNFTEFM